MLHAKMELIIVDLKNSETQESLKIYENLPTDLEWEIFISNYDQDPKIVINLVDNKEQAKYEKVGLMAYVNKNDVLEKRRLFYD